MTMSASLPGSSEPTRWSIISALAGSIVSPRSAASLLPAAPPARGGRAPTPLRGPPRGVGVAARARAAAAGEAGARPLDPPEGRGVGEPARPRHHRDAALHDLLRKQMAV